MNAELKSFHISVVHVDVKKKSITIKSVVLTTYRIMFISVETYNFEFRIENFWTVTLKAELKPALSLHMFLRG